METLENNRSMQSMAQGPGMYRLEDSKLRNKISYPWAPNVQLQKMGGSVFEENFIDIESEIHRLNKPLSNNPNLSYMPLEENKEYNMISFEDGGPNPEEHTRLSNNAFELKGVGINRFDFLPFDPQVNCIEPFRRIGTNTVLNTLDQHVTDCPYKLGKGGDSKPHNA